MFTLNKKYFLIAVVLFVVEVLIALFVNDRIIRPYVGDYLVVILLYCAVRSVIDTTINNAAIGVLIFAYAVEVLQYLNLVARLGLANNTFANVVIGNRFEWIDILAYTLGIVTVVILERKPMNTERN